MNSVKCVRASGQLARWIVVALLALMSPLAIPPLHAQAKRGVTYAYEPMFGLSYDPRRTHFEMLPIGELLPACKEILGPGPLPRAAVLFARYETASTKIYVAGLNDDLFMYVIRDGKCHAEIPMVALSQQVQKPPFPPNTVVLSDEEVAATFNDALDRYTKAFGDEEGFFHWLDNTTERMRSACKGEPDFTCPATFHTFPLKVKEALERYRGSSVPEPLFGLSYDPKFVHFETLQSDELLPECQKVLLDYKPIPREFVLYAKHETSTAKIYVAGVGDNVAIYAVRDGTCAAGVASLVMFKERENRWWVPPKSGPLKLSNAEVVALFNDALARYSGAFGGRESFFHWLDSETEMLKMQCDQADITCPRTYRTLPLKILGILQGYRRKSTKITVPG